MDTYIEDWQKIDRTKFSPNMKLYTKLLMLVVDVLRQIAEKQRISPEQITVEHVLVHCAELDEKVSAHFAQFAAFAARNHPPTSSPE